MGGTLAKKWVIRCTIMIVHVKFTYQTPPVTPHPIAVQYFDADLTRLIKHLLQ